MKNSGRRTATSIYPYLYDGDTQAVAALKFGVAATPQVYVFDRERKLRYQGRIDDNVSETLVKTQDARNAIEALVAGREVPVSYTVASGCPANWLSKPSGPARDAPGAEPQVTLKRPARTI